jgi:hypothetical protein
MPRVQVFQRPITPDTPILWTGVEQFLARLFQYELADVVEADDPIDAFAKAQQGCGEWTSRSASAGDLFVMNGCIYGCASFGWITVGDSVLLS